MSLGDSERELGWEPGRRMNWAGGDACIWQTVSRATWPENLALPASAPCFRLQGCGVLDAGELDDNTPPAQVHQFYLCSSFLLLKLCALPAARCAPPISTFCRCLRAAPASAASRSHPLPTAAGRARTALPGWGRCRPTLGATARTSAP